MRLLHTADWHLGRALHGASLLEDQAHVLDQLVDLASKAEVDAVLVAGDVYDRSVPPPDAVELLDDVLSRLVLGVGVPVVMIAGNHDSPGRLGFGARVLRKQGLYVRSYPQADPDPIVICDEHGPVHIVPLPYAEPSLVRERVAIGAGGVPVRDHDQSLRALLKMARAAVPEGERAVLMAHAFVAGGVPSESERPIMVGGAGQVGVGRFRGFDYVALGHLHQPQRMGSDRVWYSGSLLKYSFEEARQSKSVNLVEIGEQGGSRVECVALSPRRDVRCVRGTLREILERPVDEARRDDYLHVTLDDRAPIFDPLGKLRTIYPNVLQLERPFLAAQPDVSGLGDHRRLDQLALFERFFAEVTGEDLDDEQRRVFAQSVAAMRESDREVSS